MSKMIVAMIISTAVYMTMSISTVMCLSIQRNFINIEGPDLLSKWKAAQSRSQSSPAASYWIAYQLPVRPNVVIEAPITSADSASANFIGATIDRTGNEGTRNVAIFFFYNKTNSNQPTQAGLYDLDHRNDDGSLPVYWLGQGGKDESLNLLSQVIGQSSNGDVAVLTEAIALHDDTRAEVLLERLARNSTHEQVRTKAVLWLGRLPGHLPVLEQIAGDKRESMTVRKRTIASIGKSRQPETLNALQRLFDSNLERELKEETIDAIAKSRQPDAMQVLAQIAQTEKDPDLSARARSRIAKASGEKARLKTEKKAGKSF